MQFDECFEGPYRIFVGALDAPRGEGFIAAVVVSRWMAEDEGADGPAAATTTHAMHAARGAHGAHDAQSPQGVTPGVGRAREVWRDDSLACGYRWPTPEAALHYAKNRAREMVRKASPMLASAA